MFVFTPKYGSGLNLIESFFSKMTKQMLKGIRVQSKQELEERIVVNRCNKKALFKLMNNALNSFPL